MARQSGLATQEAAALYSLQVPLCTNHIAGSASGRATLQSQVFVDEDNSTGK